MTLSLLLEISNKSYITATDLIGCYIEACYIKLPLKPRSLNVVVILYILNKE